MKIYILLATFLFSVLSADICGQVIYHRCPSCDPSYDESEWGSIPDDLPCYNLSINEYFGESNKINNIRIYNSKTEKESNFWKGYQLASEIIYDYIKQKYLFSIINVNNQK